MRDQESLSFFSPNEFNTAFSLTEERLVDKTGCVSFQGLKWEVCPDLIGFKMDVSYTHSSQDDITIYHGSIEPRLAHPLKIKEFVTQKLSVKPQPLVEASNSRMLDAMKKKPVKSRAIATSYAEMAKEGDAK